MCPRRSILDDNGVEPVQAGIRRSTGILKPGNCQHDPRYSQQTLQSTRFSPRTTIAHETNQNFIMSTSPKLTSGEQFQPLSPNGLTLQIDFAWSKFRNVVSEKDGLQLTPLYIQHFRALKPNLLFDRAADNTQFATGTINNISIAASCTIGTQTIPIKPLKRWKTQYNYLSNAFSTPSSPAIPISWIANSTLKTWDFVCLDATTQMPIAKFAVNFWAMVQVGNIYFEKSKKEVSEAMRDEVVVTGLTILYVMMTRMNNPLHLLGAAFAKPGRVDGEGEQREGGLELEDRKER